MVDLHGSKKIIHSVFPAPELPYGGIVRPQSGSEIWLNDQNLDP